MRKQTLPLLVAFGIAALTWGGLAGCGEDSKPESNCRDNIDNDGDGLTDCDDDDCLGYASCPEVECEDGIDNDGDGLTDCEDDDCERAEPCQLTCLEIVDCARLCSMDLGCIGDCAALGCTTGQNDFDVAATCFMESCQEECYFPGNPDSPECEDCMYANCSTEMQNCTNSTCP